MAAGPPHHAIEAVAVVPACGGDYDSSSLQLGCSGKFSSGGGSSPRLDGHSAFTIATQQSCAAQFGGEGPQFPTEYDIFINISPDDYGFAKCSRPLAMTSSVDKLGVLTDLSCAACDV